ncbi:MAG TPA: valine--tRNA ligase [Pirellulales bacterium]|nr:valine--tRNA ligase [Pirellulales bacterium]
MTMDSKTPLENQSASSAARELPKQYDHQAAQNRWYPVWEERGYFHAEPGATDAHGQFKKPFTIVIPPPNVTGALHLGHALNNTLQDILIRSKRMQGYNVLYMPGTDHAGIATQAVVERRILQAEKQSRHELGREKLVARIWQWKDEYEARIIGQLKQMGCSCDWQRTRFTLDEVCARAVQQTFFNMFKDGYIYRGKRLVNWDTYLQTAVSDDEVFHETVQGHFWNFKYPVIDPQPGEPEQVTIATTRPETMLGDTAVAVHPDPARALAEVERDLRDKLAVAAAKEQPALEKQLAALLARRSTMLPLLEKLRDMALAGRKLRLPLVDREIPLITDDWAKPDLGTGCVKITPAHDPNDYEVGRRHQLPSINIMNPDGTINEYGGAYRGLTMAAARAKVVEDLTALGLINPETDIEDREIELAHSDRSKTPIEPYLSDQWFVKMGDRDDGRPGLAQMATDAVSSGQVQITPSRYAKSYLDWLGEKRDWCIGRQLWWGHRVPVWRLADATRTDKLKVAQLVDSNKAQMAYQPGMSRQPEVGEQSQTRVEPLICLGPGSDLLAKELELQGYEQDPDVLDTWFSSALWPHSTLGWPGPRLPSAPGEPANPDWETLQNFYPTSVLCTSRDIITLWVARMVLTGLYNVGEIPFRDVYIHPKILDGFGEGMSKSKGNGVDPLDVMEKFGADAMRFSLAHLTTETQDVRIPVEFECPHCQARIEQTKKNRVLPTVACKSCGQEFSTQWAKTPAELALPRGAVVSERFELARSFCNKLWNAARFALMNLEGFVPGPVADRELAVEDRWILSRLATVTQQVTEALERFQFSEACRVLYEFAWDEFCSFYVEMVKARLQDPQQAATAQRVLAHALDTLLRLLHPITPFITEEVWQLLAEVAPRRGLDYQAALAGETGSAGAELPPPPSAESVMLAPWPEAQRARIDPEIEARFGTFQKVLAGLREIRSRQNIPPRTPISFVVRCDDATAKLLRPMAAYFHSMAGATATAWGETVSVPAFASQFTLPGLEVSVDLAGLIDVAAEQAKQRKELDKLTGFIAAKEKKLSQGTFAEKAPPDVIQKERDSLRELVERLAAVKAAIENLSQLQK